LLSPVAPAAQAFTFGSTELSSPVGNPGIHKTIPTVDITTADVNKSFSVDWLLPKTTVGISENLSANGVFKVNSFSSNLLSLSVMLTNTTAASFQAAILATGLGVESNAVASYASVGTTFKNVSAGQGGQQQFPGGFKNIDVCIFAANNCSGGKIKQGLQSGGNFDSFTLNLAGNFGAIPSVKLNSFAMKFQTQQGSYEIPGSIQIEEEPEPIPEPTVLLGLVAIGGALKLLRQNQAEHSAN
jgi:hypothetical protein